MNVLSLSACLNMKIGTAFTKIALNLFYELNSKFWLSCYYAALVDKRKKKNKKKKAKLIKL